MTIAGELMVRVAWDGRRVEHVDIRSTRPFMARRVLAGREPGNAVATVPLLFSICRRAQRAAAAGAIDAAQTGQRDSNRAPAHIPVLLEMLQEHFSHLLIDVPRAMRRDCGIAAAASGRKRIEAALQASERDEGRIDPGVLRDVETTLEALAASEIYGTASARWFNLAGFDDLLAWVGQGTTLPARLLSDVLRDTPTLGASDVELMPPTSSAALLSTVAPAMARERDFARAPLWDGAPVETGPLARMREHRLVAATLRHCGHGVVARLVARLVELALLLRDAQDPCAFGASPAPVQTFAIAPGEGMAAVQTARGVLLHRARVAEGRIVDYQIVAPTEWNFHPAGALVRGLAGMAAADRDEIERRAALVAQALDPCVGLRIEVGHA